MTTETPSAPSDLARDESGTPVTEKQAWSALWALLIGFFMILVDSTIVTTALPAIIGALHTDLNGGVWVTSSYLLAYAVPLLITGRLGDRFGPRTVYLVGMAVFTLSSLACGLATSITSLIVARGVQGIGASLMSPQSMTVITRLFPARRRGAAMGVWGATAGVAGFVGPILGGVLVDTLGWEWIFFVNVPVGLIGLWRCWAAVPRLSRHSHSLDWLGVALSGLGMFCLVFGIQEGESFNWGTITGIISVPLLIAVGLALNAVFLLTQTRWARRRRPHPPEPLLPLGLFTNRNFSLANVAIFFVGITVTAQSLPTAIYLQKVRGLTPTMAALVLAPTAVLSGVLSPWVGKKLQTMRSGRLAALGTGLTSLAAGAWWLTMTHTTPFWVFVLIAVVAGTGAATMWGPISLTCTHDLGQADAGAGSGAFNTTRQVGSVLGSALIAMAMDAGIAARHDMARGLGVSMLVPTLAALCAALCCMAFADFQTRRSQPRRPDHE